MPCLAAIWCLQPWIGGSRWSHRHWYFTLCLINKEIHGYGTYNTRQRGLYGPFKPFSKLMCPQKEKQKMWFLTREGTSHSILIELLLLVLTGHTWDPNNTRLIPSKPVPLRITGQPPIKPVLVTSAIEKMILYLWDSTIQHSLYWLMGPHGGQEMWVLSINSVVELLLAKLLQLFVLQVSLLLKPVDYITCRDIHTKRLFLTTDLF